METSTRGPPVDYQLLNVKENACFNPEIVFCLHMQLQRNFPRVGPIFSLKVRRHTRGIDFFVCTYFLSSYYSIYAEWYFTGIMKLWQIFIVNP